MRNPDVDLDVASTGFGLGVRLANPEIGDTYKEEKNGNIIPKGQVGVGNGASSCIKGYNGHGNMTSTHVGKKEALLKYRAQDVG